MKDKIYMETLVFCFHVYHSSFCWPEKESGWVGGVTPTEVSSLNNESGVSPLLCPAQAILQSVYRRKKIILFKKVFSKIQKPLTRVECPFCWWFLLCPTQSQSIKDIQGHPVWKNMSFGWRLRP